ncbi:MAG: ribonuclease P protein component [Chitinophagia bacterium]|nr:ribonuclease P protein component [Chitinophagia bacterium]NCA29269.1 ribonuclease P protein component [Chitinophagia bacterium]NDD15481.1 ribonuclease P protein component [Chitinophagia bacterium]
MSKVFTYQKTDKLKSRKQTQHLFSSGQAITVFPIRLIYTIEPIKTTPTNGALTSLLQAGVGAPSRIFRKAVQRNRVKRLLREAYRLEKPNFISQATLENKRVNLFLLYTDALVLTQLEIQGKVKEALSILATKLNK